MIRGHQERCVATVFTVKAMMNGRIVVAALALAAFPALAEDLSGPACVIDGDSLMINGKRRFGKCAGGTEVKLFGIDAPELEQTCIGPKDETWECGRAAGSLLLKAIRDRQVQCEERARDHKDRMFGVCRVDGLDLGAYLVGQGAALADPAHGHDYKAAEANAQKAHTGLWAAKFQPPWIWRKDNNKP